MIENRSSPIVAHLHGFFVPKSSTHVTFADYFLNTLKSLKSPIKLSLDVTLSTSKTSSESVLNAQETWVFSHFCQELISGNYAVVDGYHQICAVTSFLPELCLARSGFSIALYVKVQISES